MRDWCKVNVAYSQDCVSANYCAYNIKQHKNENNKRYRVKLERFYNLLSNITEREANFQLVGSLKQCEKLWSQFDEILSIIAFKSVQLKYRIDFKKAYFETMAWAKNTLY